MLELRIDHTIGKNNLLCTKYKSFDVAMKKLQNNCNSKLLIQLRHDSLCLLLETNNLGEIFAVIL